MKNLPALCTILALLLLLTGCSGNMDYGSLWDNTPDHTTGAPAQAAPSNLSAPPSALASTTGLPPLSGAQAAGMPNSAPGSSAPIKVALLLPLSGAHADIGQAMSQAAQLALFDMGSHVFELMPRDTGTTPDGAQKAAEAAIADGAQLILGPLFAPQVKAAGAVASRYGVNMIAFSTDWTLAGGNTFIMGFVPFGQVQRIVQYASSQGVHHIGVLAANDEYGNAVVSAYKSEAGRDDVSTAAIGRFSGNNPSEMSSAVQTVAHTPGLDGVLIAAGGDQARTLATLLNTDNVNPIVRRLGTGLWDDASLAHEPALQDAWFAAPSPDLRAAFEKRYYDTYGQAAPRLATLAYDATALAAVLARADHSIDHHPFDRAALTNPNGFAGIDGVFRFQSNGLAERGLAVLSFKHDGISVENPAPRTFQQGLGQ